MEVAWGLVTFFIPVVIAFENLGLYESLKHSAGTMKKTFGKSVAGAVLFDLLMVVVIIGFPMLWFVIFLGVGFFLGKLCGPLGAGLFIFAIPMLLSLIFGVFIISMAKTMFKTVVYSYANGGPTGNFPPDLIEKSLKQE